MALTTGQTFGNYQVVRLVGEGGFGEVYEARDTHLDRFVTLKVSEAKFTERFEREEKNIGALSPVSRRMHESPKFLRNQRCILNRRWRE